MKEKYEIVLKIEMKPLKGNLSFEKEICKFVVGFDVITEKQTIDENKDKKVTADYCLEFLMKNQKATPKEIAEYYKLNYAAVSKALERLAKRGKIKKIARGVYVV